MYLRKKNFDFSSHKDTNYKNMTFYIQICLHKEQILFIKSYFELIEFKRSCLAWDQYRLLNRIRSRINVSVLI